MKHENFEKRWSLVNKKKERREERKFCIALYLGSNEMTNIFSQINNQVHVLTLRGFQVLCSLWEI